MNFKLSNLVAATLAGSMLMGFGANAMADTTDDIVNALVAKGVLTEEEGALLQRGRTGEKEAAAEKKLTSVSGKIKDGAIGLESGDGKNSIALTGRVQFDYRNSDIDDFSKVNEGVGTAFSRDIDTSSAADQFEIRRARIGVKGKLYEHFDYEVVTNVVGSSANLVDVAYINAGMFKPVQLKLGQFKQPFNLEEYGTSSNNIDFQERAYMNQITPGKKIGAMVHGVPGTGLTYSASVYQQNNFGETDSQTDGKGFAGRATINFAELAGWKESIFHVGLAGFDSEYGLVPATSNNTSEVASSTTRGTIFGFRSGGRGLNNAYRAQIAGDSLAASCVADAGAAAANGCAINTRLVSTTAYGANSATSAEVQNKAFGLETIAAYGPFKFQGEYMKSQFDAKHENTGNRVEADVKTYYAEALWLITGENYADAYKNGGWSSIKPKSIFDITTGNGKGAWELGLRYDRFDVDNTSIVGSTNSRFQGATSNQVASALNTNNTVGKDKTEGGAKTYTAGIKWILNPNMRVLLNYSHTKFDTEFRPIDVRAQAANNASVKTVDSEDLVMLRTQLSF
jgi:phosphate-selective porin OprO/OprP